MRRQFWFRYMAWLPLKFRLRHCERISEENKHE
jgi:hypothetical protein